MKALLALTLLVATLPAKAEPVLEERRTFYPSGRPYRSRRGPKPASSMSTT
jgi:hypothetical protein